jgi:hypothetical protein
MPDGTLDAAKASTIGSWRCDLEEEGLPRRAFDSALGDCGDGRI